MAYFDESTLDKLVNIEQFFNNIFQSFRVHYHKQLVTMIKNVAGTVPLLYLTCTSYEVLEVHIGSLPHFEVHI